MALRYSLALLLAALLAACDGAPPPSQSATFAAEPFPTAGPATAPAAPAPTAATAPTSLPLATSAPVPSTPELATTLPTSAPAATAEPTAPATGAAAGAGELLFLRKGALVAYDIATRKERTLADDVREFAAAPDGKTIALVRGAGRKAEIWLVGRDGAGLAQLSSNDRAEAAIAWAPDRQSLIFGSSTSEQPLVYEWQAWSAWCVASQVHVLALADRAETTFGPGCDPAFSPDGKRIAFAAPPSSQQDGSDTPNATNAIRLINRQGQNGWNFAIASGDAADSSPKGGLLVYAPAWSPDGQQVIYQRFLGYHALVDLAISEIGGSFTGRGQPLNVGAGWLLPAHFAPDGRAVAIIENNVGDARGFGGYDNWSVDVLGFSGTREIALPEGAITAVGHSVDQLPRAQAAAWSPDGAALAVLLPPGWRPGRSPNEPVNADGQPGEIWRWRPGNQPEEKLVENVDFASPVLWLPAAS